MAWTKGKSGNPGGRPAEKAFTESLRIAVNEIDPTTQKRKLRLIAERVVGEAIDGQSWAVSLISDRLDGKPVQESTITLDDKRDSTDWTRDELVAFLNDARARGAGATETAGCSEQPDKLH